MMSTADLCDKFEAQVRVVEEQFMDAGGMLAFSGEIETVQTFEDNSRVRECVMRDGTGKVLVVDGGGSMRRALLGDMLAEAAVKNGWQGIIINGCIRDSEAIGELPLGVKALGTHPLKTEKRGLGDHNVEVRFGGVTFVPGQFLYADGDGIIVAEQRLEP